MPKGTVKDLSNTEIDMMIEGTVKIEMPEIGSITEKEEKYMIQMLNRAAI